MYNPFVIFIPTKIPCGRYNFEKPEARRLSNSIKILPMKRIFMAFGTFALALVLVGAGCGKTQPDMQMQDENMMTDNGPIQVGFIGPLTGEAATYGEPGKNVIALAVEQVNASGGINGRDLQVIYEDGKCNGKDASNAMTKLATIDNVKAVLGGFCSGESLAAAPIANENKVLLFSSGSSSPDLSVQGGKYFFRDYPSDATQGKVLAEAAYKRGWRKVAVLQEQTDYAEALQETFSKKFNELGGSVIVEKFPSGSSDFRTQLTKVKDFGADALFLTIQTFKPAENILRQKNELGWNIPLIGSDILPGGDIVQNSPELIEGMLVAEYGVDMNNETLQKFIAAYQEKYGEEPPYLSYAQTEYDSVFILADALRAVGNDGEKLQEWFSHLTDWQGASGSVTFDENGDRVGGHRLEVMKDGKAVPVEE